MKGEGDEVEEVTVEGQAAAPAAAAASMCSGRVCRDMSEGRRCNE